MFIHLLAILVCSFAWLRNGVGLFMVRKGRASNAVFRIAASWHNENKISSDTSIISNVVIVAKWCVENSKQQMISRCQVVPTFGVQPRWDHPSAMSSNATIWQKSRSGHYPLSLAEGFSDVNGHDTINYW